VPLATEISEQAKAGELRAGAAFRSGGGRSGTDAAGENALALGTLAGELAGPADRFRLLAGAPLGRFFIIIVELHLAEEPLALHPLLEDLQRLIDVVVANEYLQANVLAYVRKRKG
jgi:hypothetical protein